MSVNVVKIDELRDDGRKCQIVFVKQCTMEN